MDRRKDSLNLPGGRKTGVRRKGYGGPKNISTKAIPAQNSKGEEGD